MSYAQGEEEQESMMLRVSYRNAHQSDGPAEENLNILDDDVSIQVLAKYVSAFQDDGHWYHMISFVDISSEMLNAKRQLQHNFQSLLQSTLTHEMINPTGAIINMAMMCESKLAKYSGMQSLTLKQKKGQEGQNQNHPLRKVELPAGEIH